ncbi:ankyrin repeat domain-containing protein [Endozoicomonas sp. ONNA2]|uniref:ankyrin repeat domain-containing protein n=1 Tax=Endozoicomonas sp. ONNA2 TaxID=2828741 RepID=UPI002148D19B|nr:ankyrin repeat domain-containing protein [Endozoicomonas sp. ONNA2]
MNGVGGNGADFPFECPICLEDGYIRGQIGGHSLVKTSCPAFHVFHLKCITEWLNGAQQAGKELHERQCSQCEQPALPLVRLGGESVRDDESLYCESMMLNVCRTGNLGNLKILLRENEALAKQTFRSALTDHPVHPLTVAVHYGHAHCVQALIDSHADINAADHDGETPLSIAVRLRRTDCLQILARAGADISNVLQSAVREGNLALLECLVSTQPDQLILNNALREAVEQGRTRCLEILIRTGANNLNEALRIAAERGQRQCLEILIRAGANNLNEALGIAAERGRTQCLEPLVKAGANDLEGALYIAVLTENIPGQNALIEQGADMTRVLHTAAKKGSVAYLDSQIISRYINAINGQGKTPLHIAAAKGHSQCVKKLLATEGVEVNAPDNFGLTALHLAAAGDHLETIKALVAADGVQVNAKDIDNWTALHLAARHGCTETVKALLATDGILVNEKTDTGFTALDLATQNGHIACQKLLAGNGARNNQSYCILL